MIRREDYRRRKEGLAQADKNKKEYITKTYPQMKRNAREYIKKLKQMRSLSTNVIDGDDKFGGVPGYLDLVSNKDGWTFKEVMPSVRNCGYEQAQYNKK